MHWPLSLGFCRRAWDCTIWNPAIAYVLLRSSGGVGAATRLPLLRYELMRTLVSPPFHSLPTVFQMIQENGSRVDASTKTHLVPLWRCVWKHPSLALPPFRNHHHHEPDIAVTWAAQRNRNNLPWSTLLKKRHPTNRCGTSVYQSLQRSWGH